MNTPGGHGEVGATVTIDPPLSAESGPVYFRYLGPSAIVPAREITETSLDGGVLFLNVPPGDYVLSAHKAGMRFRRDAGNARNSAETQTRKPSHKRGPRKPSLRADRRWIEVGGSHWVEKATARTRRRK